MREGIYWKGVVRLILLNQFKLCNWIVTLKEKTAAGTFEKGRFIRKRKRWYQKVRTMINDLKVLYTLLQCCIIL